MAKVRHTSEWPITRAVIALRFERNAGFEPAFYDSPFIDSSIIQRSGIRAQFGHVDGLALPLLSPPARQLA
jgi:hypothetical protein